MNTSRMNEPNGRKDSEKADATQEAPFNFVNFSQEPTPTPFPKLTDLPLQSVEYYAAGALDMLSGMYAARDKEIKSGGNGSAMAARLRQIKEKVEMMESIGGDDDLMERAEACRVDLTEALPPPDVLLEIKGAMVLTRGNFICITGHAKSKKSFLVDLFAAEMIVNGLKVCYIDTEQEKRHTQLQGKRILAKAGLHPGKPSELFDLYRLRDFKTEERHKVAEAKMSSGKYDVVFIDGIRDLVRSINSEEEATDINDWLLSMSAKSQIGIVVILHMNKGNDNVRGHIGTEVMNKAETTLSVKKDENNPMISIVEPTSCRNKEFEKFSFMVDEERVAKDGERYGIPKIVEYHVQTEEEKWYENFRKAFKTKEALRFTELETYLMGLIGVKERTAVRRIKEATEGSVDKNGDKVCKLNPAPLVKDDEGLYRLNPKAKPVDVEDDVEPL